MDYDNIPSELFEKHPIEKALDIIGFFERSEYGLAKRNWGPIEVVAGPWIGNWKLIITIRPRSSRMIYIPQEYCVCLTMRPIDILVIIYNACDSLFQHEEPPRELLWGKMEWERYNEEKRQEYERRPKVWAEKDFFRFCINYLEKNNDWSSEDYDIEFSHIDGQLKLKAKDDVVFCPAIGTFNGTLTMSARQLFRRLPKRFVSTTVFIQVLEGQKATIANHLIPARWVENLVPQGHLATSLGKSPDVLLEYGFIRRDEESTDSIRLVWYEKTFDRYDSQLRLIIQIEYELDIYDDDTASYSENRIYTLNDVYLVVTDRQMQREGDKHDGYYYEDTELPREIDRLRLKIDTFEQLRILCNTLGDNLPNRNTENLYQGPPAVIEEVIPANTYGATNKLFTVDKANEARELLRKKLGGIHKGAPLDPEVAQAGIEPLLQNNDPLNRKAKQFLKQVKEIPDWTGLYCLQLAIWGVEKGGLEIDYRVKESLPILWGKEPPDQMMKKLEGYLVDSDDPNEVFDLLNGHKTPEDLAWAVLDRVRDLLDPVLGLSREPTRD